MWGSEICAGGEAPKPIPKSMFETFEMADAQALLDPVDAASVQEELCEEVVDQHGFFEP